MASAIGCSSGAPTSGMATFSGDIFPGPCVSGGGERTVGCGFHLGFLVRSAGDTPPTPCAPCGDGLGARCWRNLGVLVGGAGAMFVLCVGLRLFVVGE